MTKQKRGMFRRMIDVARRSIGLPVTHNFSDRILSGDPRDRKKKRGNGSSYAVQRKVGQKRRWRSPPPCIPGSITYFDMLVRKFGRRKADKYQRCLMAKQPDLLPTPELLVATPDWAWRNG